eukprot:364072-Chlamydomonas_euryale.AAC.18
MPSQSVCYANVAPQQGAGTMHDYCMQHPRAVAGWLHRPQLCAQVPHAPTSDVGTSSCTVSCASQQKGASSPVCRRQDGRCSRV